MGTEKNSSKTARVMSLLGKQTAGHSELGAPIEAQPPQMRDIETITAEILDAKRAGGEAILTIGKGLIEAKALLSHGEWLPWLEDRVEMSTRVAQNFMRLAQHYSNTNALSYLGATKALQLLALPESEREIFLSETHQVNGEEKTVIDMTSRELDRAIKERDEALKAAEQAKAEQTAAEQAREKMAEDMRLANERIAGLNAEVEARSADGVKWQKEIARLEVELSELKSRPVEVAVEADPAAVEAALKEAEAAMRDKLDKAKAAEKKAKDDLMETNSALQRAKLEREQVEVELRKQLAHAEKKTAISADADMVLFSELYEQAQILVKRMGGVRLKKRDKEPEKAEGLSNALLALLPVVKEAAGRE